MKVGSIELDVYGAEEEVVYGRPTVAVWLDALGEEFGAQLPREGQMFGLENRKLRAVTINNGPGLLEISGYYDGSTPTTVVTSPSNDWWISPTPDVDHWEDLVHQDTETYVWTSSAGFDVEDA